VPGVGLGLGVASRACLGRVAEFGVGVGVANDSTVAIPVAEMGLLFHRPSSRKPDKMPPKTDHLNIFIKPILQEKYRPQKETT